MIKMKRYIILIPVFALFGCDRVMDLFDWLEGTKTNIFVLSNVPVMIGKKYSSFKIQGEAIVVGSKASICFVLRGNFPLAASDVMEQEYDKYLKGKNITALIHTENDSKIEVDKPYQSWSKYGVIEKNDELAACINFKCASEKLTIGTKIKSIDISASSSVNVKGIYWTSTNRWDNIY